MDAVPIVVESTTADYFVLYVSHDVDGSDVDVPVLVKKGEAGTTTLEENIEALPAERYSVEKYLISDPADVDGDCIDDITELDDLGSQNPVNRAASIDVINGTVAIPDRETFELLSYEGLDVVIDFHLEDLEFVKFFLFHMDTDQPAVYFMNTVTHRAHLHFARVVDITLRHAMRGEIVYHPNVAAPDGSLGVYRFEFEPNDDYPFEDVQYAYDVLAASMPLLEKNLAYYPMPARALPLYNTEKTQYDASRVNILLEEDVFPDLPFLSLNQGTGYGFLRVMEREERPNPRDIVIYESLPNDLSRVAGIITTVPQTPLSHVNLRAVQDSIPNAFVRGAIDDDTIDSLIDSHVQFTVTRDGYTIRAATKAEVDAHYDASRPATAQTPERDLSVTEITALSEIGFDDWEAFGVKAANVAVLGTLGFTDGTVPDGFAVPFYFYDEFMKANDLYTEVSSMLADTDFQTDYDKQESELKKLRKKIKDGTTPDWIITALETMHATYPEGQSLRYRSSTNNEDLPGFSGAGLYDSKTQDPDETEDDGIDKSIKGVWESLWNFRAFVEREFHRIDHAATAMGVLVHPNYSDEPANGVAVSFDPFGDREGAYYVNTQVGEDLVTNPDALSAPEEILLLSGGSYEVLVYSNQVESEQLIMSDAQMTQLRGHLTTIHDSFKLLYEPAEGEPFAMEIEFKITSANVLAIKQARPWVFGADAKGTVTLSSTQPRVDTPVTATLTDSDGVSGAIVWTWHRSPDGTSAWAAITGATAGSYTPVATDEGNYLRATASYTDNHGPGKSAEAVSANPVLAVPNEPPAFPTTETGTRRVAEGTPSAADIGPPVAAVDPDPGDGLTYTLGGDDAGLFDIAPGTGQLLTKAVLDYESRSTYSVTVAVHDGKDLSGQPSTAIDDSIGVSITLTNEDDAGTLTLSSQQPQVGAALTATIRDSDGGLFYDSWTWERSESGTGWTSIGFARNRSYTPVDADLNHYLRVTAFYTDGHGPGKSEFIVSANRVVEPATPSRDTPPTPPPSTASGGGGGIGGGGIGGGGSGGGGFGPAPVAPKFADGFRTSRSVAENARAGDGVGEPVAAAHPDDLAITYSLNGADASLFTVDEETGQITVREGVELALGTTYTVNLTATDSAGFGAIVIVIIEVTEAAFSPYDLNDNDAIERDEVIMAIRDYFDGEITKGDVIELIKLYFAG